MELFVPKLLFLLFILNLLWLVQMLPPFPETSRDRYGYFLHKANSRRQNHR